MAAGPVSSRQAVERAIAELGAVEFRLGETDCVQMARLYVTTATGVDLGRDFPYRTWGEARRLLRKHGGLEAILRSKFGEPVAAELASDGDLATFEWTNLGLGIVAGGRVFLRAGSRTVIVPLAAVRHVYRVNRV